MAKRGMAGKKQHKGTVAVAPQGRAEEWHGQRQRRGSLKLGHGRAGQGRAGQGRAGHAQITPLTHRPGLPLPPHAAGSALPCPAVAGAWQSRGRDCGTAVGAGGEGGSKFVSQTCVLRWISVVPTIKTYVRGSRGRGGGGVAPGSQTMVYFRPGAGAGQGRVGLSWAPLLCQAAASALPRPCLWPVCPASFVVFVLEGQQPNSLLSSMAPVGVCV